MKLTDLLSPKTISVALPGRDKEEVISATIDLLDGSPVVSDLDEIRQVVLDRESQMSTGVGKGIALPHGKAASLTGSVAALSVTKELIEFGAFDGKPVRILFLLVGPPEAQTTHIRALSRISRILNDPETRQRVLDAHTPKSVYAAIKKAEKALTGD